MPNTNESICDICGLVLKSAHGVKIHKGRMHQEEKENQEKKPQQTWTTPIWTGLLERLSSLKQTTPVLERIPKGARNSYSEALNSILERCLDPAGSASENLFTFSFKAFHAPAKRSRRKTLTTVVKENLSQPEVKEQPETRRKMKKTSNEELRKGVNKKLSSGNVSGAIRLLSSEDALAELNSETISQLKEKHPPAEDDLDFPDEPEVVEVPEVTSAEVKEAIRSFPNGSAGGFDGMSPQHLKDACANENSEHSARLLHSLSRFCSFVLHGSVPAHFRHLFFGASLTPLAKKDGGIRSIAVGLMLGRLVSKIISKRVMSIMGEKFRPNQLGYGTKGGAEATVHAARNFLEKQTDAVLLKLDFRNAFNCGRRDFLLRTVNEQLPAYAALMWSAYRHPSRLLCGDKAISSETDVRQPEPIGPLLFCYRWRFG